MTPYQRWQLETKGNILPEPFSEQMPEEETASQDDFEKWFDNENDFYTEQDF